MKTKFHEFNKLKFNSMSKKIIILFSLIAITTLANAGTTITGSIMSGGISRSYRLYIPSIYNASNPPCPLIINMHGYTSNASQQQSYTNFMPIADTANFLMVYPQGTLDNNGITFWNAGVNNGLVDDLGFLSNLIDTLSTQYNINPNRVYSTGFSMGGFMSHVLACALNNKIAAIASVSGTFFTYQFPYTPNKTVPIMHIHGTADGTVPYAQGGNMIGVDNTINFWVNNNNCNTTPVFTSVPNTSTTDNSTAEHYLYTNNGNTTPVEFYKIIGGEHTWPGAINFGSTTNQDVKASKEIWRFFNQHPMIATAINEQHTIDDNDIVLYPNPASDKITFDFKTQKYNTANVIVFDNVGKQVLTQSMLNYQKAVTIDMANMPAGIYYVQVAFDKNTSIYKKLVITR